jgi:hypothetical protein
MVGHVSRKAVQCKKHWIGFATKNLIIPMTSQNRTILRAILCYLWAVPVARMQVRLILITQHGIGIVIAYLQAHKSHLHLKQIVVHLSLVLEDHVPVTEATYLLIIQLGTGTEAVGHQEPRDHLLTNSLAVPSLQVQVLLVQLKDQICRQIIQHGIGTEAGVLPERQGLPLLISRAVHSFPVQEDLVPVKVETCLLITPQWIGIEIEVLQELKDLARTALQVHPLHQETGAHE